MRPIHLQDGDQKTTTRKALGQNHLTIKAFVHEPQIYLNHGDALANDIFQFHDSISESAKGILHRLTESKPGVMTVGVHVRRTDYREADLGSTLIVDCYSTHMLTFIQTITFLSGAT